MTLVIKEAQGVQPLALAVALLALVALATLAALAAALAVIQGRALMVGLAQQALLVVRPLPARAPRLSPPQGP